MLILHPDGYLTDGERIVPLSFIIAEHPDYTLPSGAIGRRFDANGTDILFSSDKQFAGPGVAEIAADFERLYGIATASPVGPPTPDQEKQKHKAAITAKRWSVETAGITVSGANISTDAQTQSKLSGALQLVQADNTILIDWKGSDGSWVQLNASAVTAIAMAVGSHVQACFTREKELHTAVDNAVDSDALNLIDIESGSVDGSGSWPS